MPPVGPVEAQPTQSRTDRSMVMQQRSRERTQLLITQVIAARDAFGRRTGLSATHVGIPDDRRGDLPESLIVGGMMVRWLDAQAHSRVFVWREQNGNRPPGEPRRGPRGQNDAGGDQRNE